LPTVIVTDATDEQRLLAEPPQVPSDVERRTSQHGAAIGKMIEQNLPVDERAGAGWYP
jgi:hypothetical protein